MKKFTKIKLLSTTAAIATIFASSLSYACPADEVCGLDLTINDDRIINIEGIGGVDLSGVNVANVGDVDVKLPETVENAIEFSQTNLGNVTSKLDYKGQWVEGDFEAQVASIGNNVSIDLEGSNAVEGGQNNSGDIHAEGDFAMLHLVEIDSISIDTTAVGNSANVGGTGDAIIDIAQDNTGNKVDAFLDANFNGQGALGDSNIDINVAAIGNNLSIENDGFVSASLAQNNCADINAIANIGVYAMRDPITVTAVGNNLQISRIDPIK